MTSRNCLSVQALHNAGVLPFALASDFFTIPRIQREIRDHYLVHTLLARECMCDVDLERNVAIQKLSLVFNVAGNQVRSTSMHVHFRSAACTGALHYQHCPTCIPISQSNRAALWAPP
jgi:hypothetical protein